MSGDTRVQVTKAEFNPVPGGDHQLEPANSSHSYSRMPPISAMFGAANHALVWCGSLLDPGALVMFWLADSDHGTAVSSHA